MKKKNIQLKSLKVSSFITNTSKKAIKGGGSDYETQCCFDPDTAEECELATACVCSDSCAVSARC